jgi:hypothetical protein
MSKKSKTKTKAKAKQRRNKKRQLIYKQSQALKKKSVKKTRKVLRRIRAKEEKANNIIFGDILNKLGSVTL